MDGITIDGFKKDATNAGEELFYISHWGVGSGELDHDEEDQFFGVVQYWYEGEYPHSHNHPVDECYATKANADGAWAKQTNKEITMNISTSLNFTSELKAQQVFDQFKDKHPNLIDDISLADVHIFIRFADTINREKAILPKLLNVIEDMYQDGWEDTE